MNRIPATINSKGQVTLPKRIRDELQLLPGMTVQFSVNPTGELVLHRLRFDRFDAARGRADVRWRTDDLIALLRPNA
jgi:antitoxin PrlF